MEWNGMGGGVMEWNGMDWTGLDWNGMEWVLEGYDSESQPMSTLTLAVLLPLEPKWLGISNFMKINLRSDPWDQQRQWRRRR